MRAVRDVAALVETVDDFATHMVELTASPQNADLYVRCAAMHRSGESFEQLEFEEELGNRDRVEAHRHRRRCAAHLAKEPGLSVRVLAEVHDPLAGRVHPVVVQHLPVGPHRLELPLVGRPAHGDRRESRLGGVEAHRHGLAENVPGQNLALEGLECVVRVQYKLVKSGRRLTAHASSIVIKGGRRISVHASRFLAAVKMAASLKAKQNARISAAASMAVGARGAGKEKPRPSRT
mmetsp:Transcript_63821/g.195159  ORF Transcript_63821/g.195159 Transcript_63821/m.195159 type:complete len:235 (+) Transcript_63821:316-1020(+)